MSTSTWSDNPHADTGYIVVIDGRIVAWCTWYERNGFWHIEEPIHTRTADGRERELRARYYA